jgi:hypothetical protein
LLVGNDEIFQCQSSGSKQRAASMMYMNNDCFMFWSLVGFGRGVGTLDGGVKYSNANLQVQSSELQV